jgi:molybdenum cofactor cytidylyltransferase
MSSKGPLTKIRVAGLVLAAGRSARMGPEINKLTVPIDGKPLVAFPIDAMIEAGVEPVIVVTGHDEAAVSACLGTRPCQKVHHPGWASGMGSSIAFGVRAIRALDVSGLFVCVGDLPGLRASLIATLLEAFRANPAGAEDRIVVPVHEGRRGHPVLFGARHFAALARLEGEAGGRSILEARPDALVEVESSSRAILRDIDTPEDLDAWRASS